MKDKPPQNPDLPQEQAPHDPSSQLGEFQIPNIFATFEPLQNGQEIQITPLPINAAVGHQFEVQVGIVPLLLRLKECDSENLDLEVTFPTGEKKLYPRVITSSSPQCTLGRELSCEVQIPDEDEYLSISRKHLLIHHDFPSSKTLLSDPNSSNSSSYVGRTYSPEDKQSVFNEIGQEIQIIEFPIKQTSCIHTFHVNGVILRVKTFSADSNPNNCPIEVSLYDPRTTAYVSATVTGSDQYTIGHEGADNFHLPGANFQQGHVRITITNEKTLIVHKLPNWGTMHYISSEDVSESNPQNTETARIIRPNFKRD